MSQKYGVQTPNYKTLERRKLKSREGGILIFIKKILSYKIRKDLLESDKRKEILSLEISNKNSSYILPICCYKPPKGDNDILSILKQAFKKSTAERKPYYLIGDLDINSLEYFENEKGSTFHSSLFDYGAIALTNKPTGVAVISATIIDNVITANMLDESIKRSIIKSDL